MRLTIAMASSLVVASCGGGDEIQNPPRDDYNGWAMVQPAGAARGNASQYKDCVNYSATSDDLVVVFAPGGAGWDYPSGTGASGIRGAANVNGLPDDHWELAPFLSPFLQRDDPTSPTREWNLV